MKRLIISVMFLSLSAAQAGTCQCTGTTSSANIPYNCYFEPNCSGWFWSTPTLRFNSSDANCADNLPAGTKCYVWMKYVRNVRGGSGACIDFGKLPQRGVTLSCHYSSPVSGTPHASRTDDIYDGHGFPRP